MVDETKQPKVATLLPPRRDRYRPQGNIATLFPRSNGEHYSMDMTPEAGQSPNREEMLKCLVAMIDSLEAYLYVISGEGIFWWDTKKKLYDQVQAMRAILADDDKQWRKEIWTDEQDEQWHKEAYDD